MTSLEPDSPLQRLRASVADGRAQSSRFRQKQLQSLHAELVVQANGICSAIAEDTENSPAEIETEFYLTMAALRHFYETIDFAQDQRDERLLAKVVDNTFRRVGAGLVVIRPTTHTRLYSIIVPIAAAIAAGDCVLLELEDTGLNLDAGLREALPDAFKNETFSLSTERLQDRDLGSCIVVDQTGKGSSTTQLLSSSEARTIAIVDQSADISIAAKAIVTSRFSFRGMSPYAPDLVLVHESVKTDFFKACTHYGEKSFASHPAATRAAQYPSVTERAIQDAAGKSQLFMFNHSTFMNVHVLDKSCPVLQMKIQGRYLLIMSFNSMADAVSLQDQKSTLLAGYFFCAPHVGKSLSQQFDCHISCINQIPLHLLVGPAAPISHPPAFEYRYSKEMFTVSRPQFMEPHKDSVILSLALGAGPPRGPDVYTGKGISVSSIRTLAVAPLPPLKEPGGISILGVEQGLFSWAATLVAILAVIGYGVWIYGWTGAQVAELDRKHFDVLRTVLGPTETDS